jgi:phenylacetate-coenzyme A ligase PaaK-like adenylate-forming protein
MIHDWKMELYWRLPVFLQEAAINMYAGYLNKIYYGNGYNRWRCQYQERQSWSRAEAEAWQNKQLRSLIELAASKVPYYRSRWRSLEWRSVRCAADLPLLPIVDKQSIRQNESEFIVDEINPRSLWVEKTSGTTGGALKIYWPMSMLPQWWALVEIAIRKVAGVDQDLPRAMMGGRTIVKGSAKSPPYWRFNRKWRQLYLSSYHVSRRTAADYVRALVHYRSEWITGYGSAIAALAESAMEAGLPPVQLRAAIVSGDTLLPGMRDSIETFFGCKCFDSYGQCEGVSVAMECPEGRMHVVPSAGIWEILREDGSLCSHGEVGEIVATGLLNDVMPLIRYRVGDYAAWDEDQSCACGNRQPIISNLEGRVDDYVITSGGCKIGRLAGFRRTPRIHSAQFVQDSPGHAFLLVRPGRNYAERDGRAVRDDILSRIGDLEIVVVEVPEIPKTPQGKTVTVVRLGDRPEMRETYERLLRSASNHRPGRTVLEASS